MSNPTHGMFSRLHLKVKCDTEFGQTVHVSGSNFLAGRTDPQGALELVTTPEEYPVWRTKKPIIVPRHQPHKYMYAIFEGGQFKKWEDLGNARVLLCDKPAVYQEDTFGGQPGSPPRHDERSRMVSDVNSTRNSSTTSLPQRGLPPPGANLYLVCFHLPVKLSKTAEGRWHVHWNESLIAKTKQSVADRIDTHWVGTVSNRDYQEFTPADQEEIAELLRPMNCTALFVPQAVIRGSYLGYCKQILWPAFHNVDVLDLASSGGSNASGGNPTLTWDQANAATWWEAFQTLNKAFAQHMFDTLKESSVMWVHDYHLMLVPKMLSDMEKARFSDRRTNIIFFLHIPFPTSQIFRALAHGEELLQGMLSASIVGFHAFDHARHFLNAGKRLLGLSYQSIKGGLIGVEYDRRTVMVVMSHVGIEPDMLNAGLAMPETEVVVQSLREKHGSRIVVGGVDVCQKLSGVTLKLLAFERLLADYPTWRDKVVLVQRCLRPGSRVEDEEHSAAEIQDLVGRIREEYGEDVLEYTEVRGSSLELPQRMGLYKCADVMVFTAVREGLNLIPLEYIFTRQEPVKPGVVLTSEFSAASSLLNGAVRINPFDVQRAAAALDQALTMDDAERTGRRARDLPYISSRPSAEWTYQVLTDMWAMSNEARVTHLESTVMDDDLTHEMSMTGFTALNVEEVVEAYRHAQRRVLLLDYGGTLLPKEGLGKYLKRNMASVSGRKLSPPTLDAIRRLCSDKGNTVFIVSGLLDKGLMDAVGDVKRLGLAANNGLAFSWPVEEDEEGAGGEGVGNRHWEVFDYGVDWDEVKEVSLPLLQKFTAHTNGSSIKVRDTGLAWSYYATDPEWGQLQAKQLIAELEVALAAYDVKVQHVRGQLEVVPKRLHKGVVAKEILKQVLERSGQYPGFVFCVGDDVSDEHMFTSVYSLLADLDTTPTGGSESDSAAAAKVRAEADNLRLYTCTVGKKPSHASYYVDDSSAVQDLMLALANASGGEAAAAGGGESDPAAPPRS